MTNYNYAHIIDGTGFPKYDSIQSIKGGVTSTSDLNLIEKNVGGYYFNFAKSSTSYKKMSITIDLNSATFKKANTGAYPNNAYIFVGAKQNYTYETGLILSGSGTSAKLYPYYMDGDGVIHTQTSKPIVVGTRNSSTGIVSLSGTVRITLGVGNSQQICKVENLTTGASWEQTISNSRVSGSQATRFFYAVSLPPDDPSGALNDLRSGAYFLQVKVKNPLLYTSTSATTGVSAAPSSSASQYAFLYLSLIHI